MFRVENTKSQDLKPAGKTLYVGKIQLGVIIGGGGHGNGPVDEVDGNNGIVIISYPTGTVNATGGTKTINGADTIHTFTTDGTF